ncbi:MAG: hypothetical protein Q9M89_01430 [Persephonella sp.]|nr:hypothetical protein [Persephonella sp.]
MNINRINLIDYAFQPIVNIHTGVTVAFEALIRNVDKLGFGSIGEFFDYLYERKILFKTEIILRKKVLNKFKRFEDYKKYRIFTT